jgi:hypothetical protein
MDFEAIAECEIECVFPDGSRRIVHLRIGRPFPAPDMDWGCRVAASGLHEIPGPLYGVDSWQALLLAQRFLEAIMQGAVDDGVTLHWPPGDSRSLTVRELFARGTDA